MPDHRVTGGAEARARVDVARYADVEEWAVRREIEHHNAAVAGAELGERDLIAAEHGPVALGEAAGGDLGRQVRSRVINHRGGAAVSQVEESKLAQPIRELG